MLCNPSLPFPSTTTSNKERIKNKIKMEFYNTWLYTSAISSIFATVYSLNGVIYCARHLDDVSKHLRLVTCISHLTVYCANLAMIVVAEVMVARVDKDEDRNKKCYYISCSAARNFMFCITQDMSIIISKILFPLKKSITEVALLGVFTNYINFTKYNSIITIINDIAPCIIGAFALGILGNIMYISIRWCIHKLASKETSITRYLNLKPHNPPKCKPEHWLITSTKYLITFLANHFMPISNSVVQIAVTCIIYAAMETTAELLCRYSKSINKSTNTKEDVLEKDMSTSRLFVFGVIQQFFTSIIVALCNVSKESKIPKLNRWVGLAFPICSGYVQKLKYDTNINMTKQTVSLKNKEQTSYVQNLNNNEMSSEQQKKLC